MLKPAKLKNQNIEWSGNSSIKTFRKLLFTVVYFIFVQNLSIKEGLCEDDGLNFWKICGYFRRRLLYMNGILVHTNFEVHKYLTVELSEIFFIVLC